MEQNAHVGYVVRRFMHTLLPGSTVSALRRAVIFQSKLSNQVDELQSRCEESLAKAEQALKVR